MSVILTYQKTLFACATVLFAAALMWAFRGNSVPVLSDEIGYLSIANYLLTGEAMNLSSLASYRFGQAIVLLPAFLAGSDELQSYQYGVVISCIQTALIPVVLLGIARRLDLHLDWRVVGASFLVAVLPAYFYQNSVVWPETTFRLFSLVLVYLVATAWQEKRTIWWLLTSACVVWLYALHSRALGIIPIVLVLIWSAHTRKKLSSATALASVAIIVCGAWLVGFVQQQFTEVLWHGNGGGDAGQVTALLGALVQPGAFRRVLAVLTGHAWSLVASSLGLFVVGLCATWILLREKAHLWPVLLFAGFATAIIFAASVAQMIGFTQIDHVIYSRYNDGASSFFVWLGLLAVLRVFPLPKNTALIATGMLVVLGFAVVFLANGYPIARVVTPNLSAFIWTSHFVSFSTTTLAIMVLLGTAAALVGSLMFFALPTRAALASLVVFVAASDLIIKRVAWQEHRGREAYLEITGKAYRQVNGVIHWDRSSAGLGDNVIDQYMAISKPMPWSNIGREDIAYGDATVVAGDLKKDGYTCIARLPNKAKLLQRGAGPDVC